MWFMCAVLTIQEPSRVSSPLVAAVRSWKCYGVEAIVRTPWLEERAVEFAVDRICERWTLLSIITLVGYVSQSLQRPDAKATATAKNQMKLSFKKSPSIRNVISKLNSLSFVYAYCDALYGTNNAEIMCQIMRSATRRVQASSLYV